MIQVSTNRKISTHALREEGDGAVRDHPGGVRDFYPRPPRGGRHRKNPKKYRKSIISTHALREEGDRQPGGTTCCGIRFLPTPSARRATLAMEAGFPRHEGFLPTPSARRATRWGYMVYDMEQISTHALREEGDAGPAVMEATRRYFYPRPPRGGRPDIRGGNGSDSPHFYPRPPRGGRPYFCVS